MQKNLLENFAKKSVGRRDHEDPRWRLRYHFKAINRGRWDNMSWEKNDVGEYSNTYKDRHNFSSVSIRFKGEKTSRVIPVVIFRRFFKATADMEIDPKKWTLSTRGGTDIDYTPHAERTSLSKTEIKANIKSAGKPVKEDSEYFIHKTDSNYELRKRIPFSSASLLVFVNEDFDVVQNKKISLTN
jgi:hypothetical protein